MRFVLALFCLISSTSCSLHSLKSTETASETSLESNKTSADLSAGGLKMNPTVPVDSVSTSRNSVVENEATQKALALSLPASLPDIHRYFKFPAGQAFYQQSLQPAAADLIGEWILIGHADVNANFCGMKNFYQAKGYRNSDGTLVSLRWAAPEGTTDFTKLNVEFLNQGDSAADQTATESRLDPTTKSFVQAKYGFNDQSGQNLKSKYQYHCRLFPKDVNKLVCAMVLKSDPSETLAVEQEPYLNTWGGVEIYKHLQK